MIDVIFRLSPRWFDVCRTFFQTFFKTYKINTEKFAEIGRFFKMKSLASEIRGFQIINVKWENTVDFHTENNVDIAWTCEKCDDCPRLSLI